MARTKIASGQLLAKLNVLTGSSSPVLVLFTSTRKSSGERWCPDCEDSDPIVDEVLGNLRADCQVLEVEITREEWKVEPGQGHYLRSTPFAVSGIPTLLHWDCEKSEPLKRFDGPSLLQQEELSAFISTLNGL